MIHIFNKDSWKRILENDGCGCYMPFKSHFYASQIFLEGLMVATVVVGSFLILKIAGL
jgi:hypothetical protein